MLRGGPSAVQTQKERQSVWEAVCVDHMDAFMDKNRSYEAVEEWNPTTKQAIMPFSSRFGHFKMFTTIILAMITITHKRVQRTDFIKDRRGRFSHETFTFAGKGSLIVAVDCVARQDATPLPNSHISVSQTIACDGPQTKSLVQIPSGCWIAARKGHYNGRRCAERDQTNEQRERSGEHSGAFVLNLLGLLCRLEQAKERKTADPSDAECRWWFIGREVAAVGCWINISSPLSFENETNDVTTDARQIKDR